MNIQLPTKMLCSRFKLVSTAGQNVFRCLSTTNVAVEWDNALPFDALPGPKPLPIIGNILRFFPRIGEFYGKNFLELYSELHKKHGDILVLKGLPGRNPMVITFSVKDIESMFRNEGPLPTRPGLDSFRYYREHIRKDIYKVLGVATAQGEAWWDIRKKVNPVLMKPQSMKRYTKRIATVTDDLCTRMDYLLSKSPKSELPEDFLNELYRWSLETTCAVNLDTRLGCLDNHMSHDSEAQKMIDATIEMFECLYKLDYLPSFWKYVSTPTFRKLVKTNDFITDYVMKQIDAAEQRLKNKIGNDDEEPSILEQLMAIDKAVACVMVNDAMIAGTETTSKTAASIMYFLAVNKDAQDKLREEINTLWPDSSEDLTNKQIDQMLYLRACIKEAQRIAPVAVGNIRILDTDIVLSGYQIPKGTEILTPQICLCASEEYFTQPDKFMPERWLRTSPAELSARSANMFAYLPFGHGPRSCIGKRFALLNLEIIIVKLFKKYEFKWNYGPMRFTNKLMYEVADPLRFEVRPVN